MPDTQKKSQKFKLNILERLIMLSAICLQILLYIIFNLKVIHYVFHPLPLFHSPSLLQSIYFQPYYLYNFFLYISFFVQHIVMAMITFKLSVWKFIPKYPLYERFIYNIASSWWYLLVLEMVRPVFLQSQIIFVTPAFLNIFLTALSTVFLFSAIWRLGGDIFIPFQISDILSSESIQFEGYEQVNQKGLVSTGLYGCCRHPMQGSVLILMMFVSNIYTVDRLIFILAHSLGIILGITFEEKRLERRFLGYKQYKKQVKYRLIPYLI